MEISNSLTYFSLLPSSLRKELVLFNRPSAAVLAHLPGFEVPEDILLNSRMDMCRYAVSIESLKLLKWAIQEKCGLFSSAMTEAQEKNNLFFVQWLHCMGAPWPKDFLSDCCHSPLLPMAKWALYKGCPFDADRAVRVAISKNDQVAYDWVMDLSSAIKLYGEELLWAALSSVEWFSWCLSQTDPDCISSEFICEIAKRGNLAILKWLYRRFPEKFSDNVYIGAFHSTWTIVEWAWDNNIPWTEDVFTSASRLLGIDKLQRLKKMGCPWDQDTSAEAFCVQKLDNFIWLIKNGCPVGLEPFNLVVETYDVPDTAHGILMLWELGCPVDGRAELALCQSAAYNGDLDLLKKHYKYFMYEAAKWDIEEEFDVVLLAVMQKKFDVVQWLHEQGWIPFLTSDKFALHVAKTDEDYQTINFAGLKWFYEHGMPWTPEASELIAKLGDSEYLEWAWKNGCPKGTKVVQGAIEGRNLEVLKKLYKDGFPLDTSTVCQLAASKGWLGLLQWARQNNFPWDASVYIAAAEIPYSKSETRLLIMDWAWKNGCPWDTTVTSFFVKYPENIFYWLLQKGCPVDIEACRSAIKSMTDNEPDNALLKSEILLDYEYSVYPERHPKEKAPPGHAFFVSMKK